MSESDIPKTLLQKLVSLWSSIIDKTGGSTGNKWAVRTTTVLSGKDPSVPDAENQATITSMEPNNKPLINQIMKKFIILSFILTLGLNLNGQWYRENGFSSTNKDKLLIQGQKNGSVLGLRAIKPTHPYINLYNTNTAPIFKLWATDNWWGIGDSFDSTSMILSVKPADHWIRVNGTIKAENFIGTVNETVNSTFTSAPLLSVTTQKGVNEALDHYISNYRTAFQGLAWNEVTDTYQRLGSLTGLATSVSPGNGNLPVQSKMRGCVLKTDGTVNYYLNAYDWNYKEDGTASTLTGADGQVMVQIPAFYIKYEKFGNWHAWYISLYPLTGYALHPAFVKDGVNVSYRYIGAYEGVLYDASASRYANGLYLPADTVTFTAGTKTIAISGTFPTNAFTALAAGDKIKITGTASNNSTFTVATTGDKSITVTETVADETANAAVIQNERDFTATTGDKLCSVSGKVPITRLTRANSRVLATNVGAGWRQLDYDLVNALEWLILTEYGTFYIQNIAEAGPGITAISGWDKYNNYNPFAPSGNANALGNATADNAGNAAAGTEKAKYSKYRGIENFYGHIYKWVDGINVNNNIPYVTNNAANWVDNTSTNYTETGVTLAASDGYASALVNSSRVMLPSAVAGNATTFVTDSYYQSTGWSVAAFGGTANYVASTGAWCWGLYYSSASAHQDSGARLAF